MQEQLSRQIEKVARRLRRNRLLKWLSLCWLLAALIGAVTLIPAMPAAIAAWVSAGVLFFAAAVAGLSVFLLLYSRRFDHTDVARAVEQQFPNLDTRLLAAIEQQPDLKTGRMNFLQMQVIREAVVHGYESDWTQTVSTRRLVGSFCLNLACLGLLITIAVILPDRAATAGADGSPSSALAAADAGPGSEYRIEIEPGDASIERGSSLLVLARFGGKLPGDILLVSTNAKGEPRRTTMTKSLDDPLFGARIGIIKEEMQYRVEYDDLKTRDFRVTVFDYPQLDRADAIVAFPEYTGLEETVLEDVRRLSIVEGSSVTLSCLVNKPLASARLQAEGEPAIVLKTVDGQRSTFEITLQPTKKALYTLHLTDDEGRKNKYPPEIIIDVTPNRRPELKLAFPAKDLRVSPIEEVSLQAAAWDDFGLKSYGMIYSLGGSQPQTVVLGEAVPGKENREIVHMLSFEQLQAEPDQLVSYYFFADDFGPDGKVRRTFSDMYFAEVRHFEEIFRQGQQPPGGQSKKQQQQKQQGGQNAQKAEKLAELQKQIVNATWKLIRRETSSTPSKEFPKDVTSIQEAQAGVIKQLAELEEKLTDATSKALVTAVNNHANEALKQLTKSLGDGEALASSPRPLAPALSAEQAAYQALLKLRAREFKVTKGQQQGSQSGKSSGGNRSQQQLQQLELSNKENRYQTERNSSSQRQQSANREQLQVLNRLRELARRQGNLNEKLKELENELRAAQTEKEKEELNRQLKRLRDEQQQMLRDLDEVMERMSKPENERKMADAQKQLNDTREKIRQSSEALKEGQVSKALNAGTRAERNLKEMRDKIRKQTAGQFSDEMKNLQQQARDLADREEDLQNKLKETGKKGKSLRYSKARKEVEEGLADQKDKLEGIFDRMKDVVQRAETSEPLLSKQLYDTIRKSREQKPVEGLEAAADLVKRGFLSEAELAEKQASRGIDAVKRGIEKVAEGVLGDEVESLKRAREELRDLTKAVDNELAQADPQQQRNRSQQSGQQGKQQQQDQTGQQRNQSGQQQNQPGQQQIQPGQKKNQNGQQGKQSGQRQDQPGQQKNQPGQQGNQPGQQKNQNGQQGNPPGQQKNQPGQQGKQPGQQGNQPGSQPGQQPGQQPGTTPQQGSQPGQQSQGGRQNGGRQQSFLTRDGRNTGPGGVPGGPIRGDDFKEFSDRLRDVEELIDDPKLRAEASKIRERARSMRVDFKRHSKEPNWDLVRTTILEPLVELQTRVSEEIAKRESKEAVVPIDRDPVPDRYAESVRRYLERIGKGKQ